MRDELGTFFRDEDFLDVFSDKGQPAESAWRLALVMHYAEGLTDRQAAEAVRTRIDWKYAGTVWKSLMQALTFPC
ncbi:MAG: hypothetical protein ACR2H5_01195 [Ktedonobacteraceae bacterium]